MKVLIIDNYDSFTFNLVQLLNNLDAETIIYKNDMITLNEILQVNPDKILISPGPGNPDTAGNCLKIVEKMRSKVPILGICLGMQVIAKQSGAKIQKSRYPVHGKVSAINHDGQTLFRKIPQKFLACRYHSLEVQKNSLKNSFQVSATTDGGIVMGIRHKRFKLEGVQFHPEAILTEYGKQLIENWLED